MDEQHNTIIREQEYSDAATQRTIIDLIDIETGEFVDANMLDTMTEAELSELKELQSLAKKSGDYKYVCAVCGQPLRLDSRHYASRKYKSYFFSHYSTSEDCPLKTSSDAVDPVRSTIKWYSKFKESPLHKDMCQKLMNILSIDERFSNVVSYPTINIYGEDVHWHKPDVASDFYGNQLVFETLMYNTFLSNIIDKNSFYRMAKSFLLWVFPHFSIDNQTMCEKDVYYTHRRNIFVFDSENYYRRDDEKDSSKPQRPIFAENGYLYAQEESQKRGRLMLNCYWQIPVVVGDEVKIEWHHKLVGIEELTFDAIRRDVFFHNSDYDFKEVADPQKRELIENWERAKEDRWSKIFQGLKERKERYELAEGKKVARENEQNILSRILAGDVVPEPFKADDGRYGYKVEDAVVIKPQYGVAFPFREGVAIVGNRRNKRGLINLRNERVLDIIYDKVVWLNQECSNIVACTSGRGNSWNLYNTHGDKISDYNFSGFKKVGDNFIFVSSDIDEKKYGIISSEGVILIKPLYDKITSKDDEKFVLQYGGRTKTISLDEKSWKTTVVSELLPGKFVAENMLFQGVVDNNGNTILPFEYSKIERISDRYILIVKKRGRLEYNGLLDCDFNEVIPLQYDSIIPLQNGFIIKKDTLYGPDLSIILEGYYSIVQCPDGKFILCQKKKQGWYKSVDQFGLADENGEILFPCYASEAKKDKDGNVKFSVETLGNGKSIKACFGIYVLFDKEDEILSNREYSSMKELPNGNFLVKYKGKCGIIDSNGKEIIECKYDSLDLTEKGDVKTSIVPIDSFCQKTFLIDKYALTDKKGVNLTNYIYDNIELITDGIYVAIKGSDYSLLDKTGKTVFSSYGVNKFKYLGKDRILFGNYSNYGVINKKGIAIVPCQYSNVELLPNGNMKVTKNDYRGEVHGLYSSDGSVIADCDYHVLETDESGNISPKFESLCDGFLLASQLDKVALAKDSQELLTDYGYDSLEVFDDNFFKVKLKWQEGLIDREGHIVLPMTNNNIISCITKDRFVVGRLKKGIVDSSGSVIVPIMFDNMESLPNNTWKVEIKNSPVNSLFGIYGDDGKVIYDCKYKELDTDSEGNVVPVFKGTDERLFKVRFLDKYALCSDDKTLLTDYLYDDILETESSYFIVVLQNKQGVVDASGNEIMPLSALRIETVVDGKHFIVQQNLHYSIVNDKGESLTSELYSNISSLANGTFVGQRYNYNSISSSIRYTYEIMDSEGAILFSANKQIEFDDNCQPVTTTELSYESVLVKQCAGKYAIIALGESASLSDFVYDSVEPFADTMLKVRTGKKYGLFSMDGNSILPVEYNSEFEMLSLGIVKFNKGYSNEKRYGLVNSSGKVLAQPEYTFIRENTPGHFKLFYKEDNQQKSKYLDIKEPVDFSIGHVYSGRVNGIQEYGIFVRVNGGGSGLLHVKQLKKQGKDISSFSKGDKISVKVINIRKDGKVEFDLAK